MALEHLFSSPWGFVCLFMVALNNEIMCNGTVEITECVGGRVLCHYNILLVGADREDRGTNKVVVATAHIN